MTTTLFALAAALVVAVVYFADPAAAAGATGNFGGPLGSFATQPGGDEAGRRGEAARGPAAPRDVRAIKHPPLPSKAVRKVSTAPAQQVAIAANLAERTEVARLRQTVSVSAIAALDKPLAAAVPQPQAAEASKTAKAEEELNCKKYVAAAGLTITVPCRK